MLCGRVNTNLTKVNINKHAQGLPQILHIEKIVVQQIPNPSVKWMMDDGDDDDNFVHVAKLAPEKVSIVVGDAVVEIDTGLDEGSGNVLAVGIKGVAAIQAEIGAWSAEVSASLVAQEMPIAVGNLLIEVQWGVFVAPPHRAAARRQSRPAQLLGCARCREIALLYTMFMQM